MLCAVVCSQGMPFKWYCGKTGVVWNVTKRALGVEINKTVSRPAVHSANRGLHAGWHGAHEWLSACWQHGRCYHHGMGNLQLESVAAWKGSGSAHQDAQREQTGPAAGCSTCRAAKQAACYVLQASVWEGPEAGYGCWMRCRCRTAMQQSIQTRLGFELL